VWTRDVLSDDEDEEPFEQSERPTVRLKGLIRSYPRGIGIIKEFLQNADDAGATKLSVVMDCEWLRFSDRRSSLATTSHSTTMI
jgi:hypothetical protein